MLKLGLGLQIGNTKVQSGGVSYTSSYTNALVSKATTDGVDLSTSGAYLSVLDTALVALEAAGILAKMDVLYFLSAPIEALALYNVIDPSSFKITKVGSPTFTAGLGFNGLGSTSNYLRTGYVPATNAINMTSTSASIGVWIPENPTANSTIQIPIGSRDSSNMCRIQVITATNNESRVNLLSGGNVIYSNTPSSGLYVGNRINATSVNLYKNGLSVATLSSTASLGPTNSEVLITCANNTNAVSPSSPYTGNVSIGFLGEDLTTEQSDLYTILAAYMASL